jgi:hypothetical protein
LNEKYLFFIAQWLTLVILSTLEAEIRKMQVQGQPRQKVGEIPS